MNVSLLDKGSLWMLKPRYFLLEREEFKQRNKTKQKVGGGSVKMKEKPGIQAKESSLLPSRQDTNVSLQHSEGSLSVFLIINSVLQEMRK